MKFDRNQLGHYLDVHFFTYQDLADRVGVSMNTVYRWASGRIEPSKHNVVKMAEVFGIEPWQLMKED